MTPISKLSILATLVLNSAAFAQSKPVTLADLESTFAQLDANKDGKLSPQEIAVLKLSPADARGLDADHDGFLSRDEFLLFYRQRIVAAGAKPAADLESEATRIVAARKAKAAERIAARKSLELQQAGLAQTPESKALADAFDQLEIQAAAHQAKGTDFDKVRDLLVADARESDRLAKGEDSALGEKSELHVKLTQSLERLRNAAASGAFSREEYQAFREMLVRRARNAAKSGATAQPGAETNHEVRAIEQALTEALDRLEQRAVAGQSTRQDFEHVREQLIARARAAANSASAGQGAAATQTATDAELQGPLQVKLLQSLDRLQTAAAAGMFSREEYRGFREAIVKRFRNASEEGSATQSGATADKNAELRAIEQALNEALDRLEARAASGSATREDFQHVREQMIARARAAANGVNGAGAAPPESQDSVSVKLIQSLDRLEAAAQQGKFSREEYQQLRASMIHRAREIENPGQPQNASATPVTSESGMSTAVDDLQKRVDGGQVTPADFRPLRDLITKKAQAVAGKTDEDSVNESALYDKLLQSLDRLEKAAQNGTVDRQQFQAFRDSFVRRARNIANDGQQQTGTPASSAASTDVAGNQAPVVRPASAPVATPPVAQPAPPERSGAQRADPARDDGKPDPSRVAPNDSKPAPQARPKPADGAQEPEKQQTQRPAPTPVPAPAPAPAPAPESGTGRPPHVLHRA